MSISTLRADTLLEQNLVGIQDYASRIPGLSLNARGGGQTEIVFRGVSSGSDTNKTSAVTIDDAPFGSSLTAGGGSSTLPNLDPFDLQRIEVLRGPQGTLYGASSLGGLLKYVTIVPDTSVLSGRVQVDGSKTAHGSSGYGARAAVNVPVIADVFALRASVFQRQDPGYVDDTLQGKSDVNAMDVKGARLSAVWYPNDTVTVRASTLAQQTKAEGSGEVDADLNGVPLYGKYKHRRMPGTDSLDRDVKFSDLSVEADLHWARLTSLTSYGRTSTTNPRDITYSYASVFSALGYPGLGAALTQGIRSTKASQELRLDSPEGNRTWDWRLGIFYTAERAKYDQTITASDATSGEAVEDFPLVAYSAVDSKFQDTAVFGVVTYHFNEKADLQVGGRYSQNRQDYSQESDGLTATTVGTTSGSSDDHAFTYMLTPRYRFSPELMAYATVATGYRPGGPNLGVGEFPSSYKSDTTRNFELGLKGDLIKGRLSFATALFHIDWKDIQLLQTDETGNSFYDNAAGAKSQGLEASLSWRPWQGFTFSGNAVFARAVLTEDLPSTATSVGVAGDRLPASAKVTASLSASQDFPVGAGLKGSAGGTVTYVGDRPANFRGTSQSNRVTLPGYASVDLQAGVRGNEWGVSAFVKNVGDRYAYQGATGRSGNQIALTALQPRTVGASFWHSF